MASKDFTNAEADFLFIGDTDGSVIRKVTLEEARKMSRMMRAEIIAQKGNSQRKAFGSATDDPRDAKIDRDGNVSF